MTFKEQCSAAFNEYLKDLDDVSESEKEFAKQSFLSGFDYGSLNGASEDIKESVIKNLYPIKNKKVKEMINKIREIRSS